MHSALHKQDMLHIFNKHVRDVKEIQDCLKLYTTLHRNMLFLQSCIFLDISETSTFKKTRICLLRAFKAEFLRRC